MPRRFTAALRFTIIAAFVLTASYWIERPGLSYDEVLFVNASLGGIDGEFIHARVWHVPVLLMTYIGALKSWLHAPVFALFGVSPASIRMPSVIISAGTIYLLSRLGELLFGRKAGLLLPAVLVTDPAFTIASRFDWGPAVLMSFFKAAALLVLFRWLLEPSAAKLWTLVLILSLGFFDKFNFIWFVLALTLATAVVYRREVMGHLIH